MLFGDLDRRHELIGDSHLQTLYNGDFNRKVSIRVQCGALDNHFAGVGSRWLNGACCGRREDCEKQHNSTNPQQQKKESEKAKKFEIELGCFFFFCCTVGEASKMPKDEKDKEKKKSSSTAKVKKEVRASEWAQLS